MTVFVEMHRIGGFGDWRDYQELLRMLNQTIERGYVIEIPVSSDYPSELGERWFLEKETSVIFRLLDPDFPDRGEWSEVEFPKSKIV